MTLDGSGNLLVGGNSSAGASAWAAAGRGLMELNGSTGALYGFRVAGAQSGYMYHTGTDILLNNIVGGSIGFYTNNISRMTIQANGVAVHAGGALTTPVRLGNTSGAITLDCSKSNVFTMTLIGNMTSLAVTNITDGQTINVIVYQDGTGSRTWLGLTSGNGFVWPGGVVGVLSTPASSRDVLCLTFDSNAGKFFCTLAKGFA
jgi:hypothetical protein